MTMMVVYLTKKAGTAHKAFREAPQVKRHRHLFEHKGYDQNLYCVDHPSLMIYDGVKVVEGNAERTNTGSTRGASGLMVLLGL